MHSAAEPNQADNPTAWGRTVVAFFWFLIIGNAMSLCATNPFGGYSIIGAILAGAGIGLTACAFCFSSYFLMLSFFLVIFGEKHQRLLDWFLLIFAVVIASILVSQKIYVGLTTNRLVAAQTHFEKCMQPSTKIEREYPQNICADGWVTPSQGSGRCSSHGGVSRESIEHTVTFQRYTAEECNERALAASWID